MRVHWVAVPKAMLARCVNRIPWLALVLQLVSESQLGPPDPAVVHTAFAQLLHALIENPELVVQVRRPLRSFWRPF
jgi:hypothetical protein|eukprot:COSAG01_NODE_5866_length_3982_cov_17.229204_3_plen_76_part_00